jgi:heterotetrameric sarcosine oxidase delta subunit
MLIIECLNCGARDEAEFSFGGPSHVIRPSFDVSDQLWTDYLYGRDNAQGPHAERWCHTYGCGEWLNVIRDTLTDRVLFVYRMGDPMPGQPDAS